MYGHGGKHSHRSFACMICTLLMACPFNAGEKRPLVFTCFNCKKHDKTDHAANDISCPFPSVELETRARVSRKSTRSNRLILNFQYWVTKTNNGNNSYVSFATQVKNSSKLFSTDEHFKILTTAVEDLQRCTAATI